MLIQLTSVRLIYNRLCFFSFSCTDEDDDDRIGDVFSKFVSTSDERENSTLSIVEHAFRDVLKKKVSVCVPECESDRGATQEQ